MSSDLFTKLNITLKASDSELIEKFDKLKNFDDVASMLELSTNELWIILVKNKSRNYTEIKIPKKNGEERYISVPQNNLLILQKKLKYILELKFYSHFTSHGFVKEKSIVTNALLHQNKNYVINVDIKNFFPSIKYKRVVNMFVRYFRLPSSVSNTLSNIAVHHNGTLPQGSPLSPLISNVLSKSMDIKFYKLCVALGSVSYTRYADDLTFSTNRKVIPSVIAVFENGEYKIGSELKEVINSSGFLINESKFRVQSKYDHQEVTGIKVNKKININKSYVRRLRLYLHIFEVEENIENAVEQFNIRRKQRFKFNKISSTNNSLIYIRSIQSLRGMIEHLGNVRGRRDFIFIKFAKRFNEICTKFNFDNLTINIPKLMEERLKDNLLHLGNGNDFKYTLDKGLTTKNLTLPHSLAMITHEYGVISFKSDWEKFVLELKDTLYFSSNLIPVYKESDSKLVGYSKIMEFPKESNLMYLDVKNDSFSEKNFTVVDNLKIGKASLLVLHNSNFESFEGEITRIKIFNENRYNFIPNINSNLEIKEGFLFNQFGNLMAYVEKEDNYFIAKSIK